MERRARPLGSGQRPDSAPGGFGRMIVRPAATPTPNVGVLPSGFAGAVCAVFGFGAAGTAAVGPAAAACRAMRRHEDRGLSSAASPPPVSDDAAVVFASDWSFSVLCCDATDRRALSDADAVARELARRGHMAAVLGAGPLAAPLTACTQAEEEESRYRPARLLLPVPDRRGGLAPVLAASAAALLSSVACRGIVGVDASDVWSAIGGPGHGVAVLATAQRGQEAGGFGRSAVSAVHEAGVEPSSVLRLLISAVLSPGWHLRELDEAASAVSDEFMSAETIIMSAVHDPAAETATVLLVCSGQV